MTVSEPQVGEGTLEATPERLLHFILAVARYPNIRRRLRTRGYGAQQHRRGYQLLEDLGTYGEGSEIEGSDPDVKSALQELNQQDEDAVALAGAALRYKYPLHHTFVLNGLVASTDAAEAATTLGSLVDRVRRLKSGDVSPELEADAAEAVAAMAAKGLDAGWLERIEERLERLRQLPDEKVTLEQLQAKERARAEKLLELRAFFEEWADTARVEFKGRRDLIRLGLARLRRSSDGQQEVVEPVDDVASAPGAAA